MQVVMLGWGIFGISQSPAGMFLAFHHSILGPYYGDNEGRVVRVLIETKAVENCCKKMASKFCHQLSNFSFRFVFFC